MTDRIEQTRERLRERAFFLLDQCYDHKCPCWNGAEDQRDCPHAIAALDALALLHEHERTLRMLDGVQAQERTLRMLDGVQAQLDQLVQIAGVGDDE